MPRRIKRKLWTDNVQNKKVAVENTSVPDELEEEISSTNDEEVTSAMTNDENTFEPGGSGDGRDENMFEPCGSGNNLNVNTSRTNAGDSGNIHVTGSVIQIITLASDTSLSTSVDAEGTVSSLLIPFTNSENAAGSEMSSESVADVSHQNRPDGSVSVPEVIIVDSEEEGAEEKPKVETLCDKNNANDDGSKEGKDSKSSEDLECPVCLLPCVHPAKLPCSHIFCYLCLKGIARTRQPCPMCRATIPFYCSNYPHLLPQTSSSADAAETQQEQQEEKPVWFYEGRHGGWWQFEERMSNEIEENHSMGVTRFEIIICGQLYVIDTFSNIQFPKNCPMRVRRIVRDLPSRIHNKGVAGIHASCLPSSSSPVKNPFR